MILPHGGDGPLRHILGELTNTVYEEPTIDDFGEHGQLLSKGDGEVCPYTLFLGIFVSLLPKVPMKCLLGGVEVPVMQ